MMEFRLSVLWLKAFAEARRTYKHNDVYAQIRLFDFLSPAPFVS